MGSFSSLVRTLICLVCCSLARARSLAWGFLVGAVRSGFCCWFFVLPKDFLCGSTWMFHNFTCTMGLAPIERTCTYEGKGKQEVLQTTRLAPDTCISIHLYLRTLCKRTFNEESAVAGLRANTTSLVEHMLLFLHPCLRIHVSASLYLRIPLHKQD